jgi:PhoPQ-activated pathogenicity-related protein
MFTLDKSSCCQEFLRKLAALAAGLVITSALAAGPVYAGTDTALEDYVNEPDPAFSVTPLLSMPLPGLPVTAHILQVTSQEWRSLEEVDRTLWQHFLTVFVPDNVVSNTGLMFVLGGDNGDGPPDPTSAEAQALALFAIASGRPVYLMFSTGHRL